MQIKWIDALDAFSNGGYIHMATARYIVPEWFSNQHPGNNSGLTSEEYQALEADVENYLRIPVLRVSGTSSRAAMRLGMSRHELVEAGMNKSEYWDIFYPNIQGVFPKCSDAEWAAKESIEKYMIAKGKYQEYLDEKQRLRLKVVADWLAPYGITPC